MLGSHLGCDMKKSMLCLLQVMNNRTAVAFQQFVDLPYTWAYNGTLVNTIVRTTDNNNNPVSDPSSCWKPRWTLCAGKFPYFFLLDSAAFLSRLGDIHAHRLICDCTHVEMIHALGVQEQTAHRSDARPLLLMDLCRHEASCLPCFMSDVLSS